MKAHQLEIMLIEYLESDGYETEEAEEMVERAKIEFDPMRESVKVTYSNSIEEVLYITTIPVLTNKKTKLK